MKPYFILIQALILLALNSFAQTENPYDSNLKQALQYYKDKEYLKAAESYTKAFASNKDRGRIDHRYSAARCWAMAAIPDSAFYHLERVAHSGYYTNYAEISADTAFVSLYSNKRWDKLLSLVMANKIKRDEELKIKNEAIKKKLNMPLVSILDSVYNEDQNTRKQIDPIAQTKGRNSPEMSALVKVMHEKDSVNLIKVKSILDRHGWLGADEIGDRGNHVLFLVIQHSGLATQLKYLPMMREAVKTGKAKGNQLALLEDRVALGLGKRQIYGSQVAKSDEGSYVLPLEDPDNVDKRRAAVGLPPIAEYLKHYQIQWDVEQYKKDLPGIEAKVKPKRK